MRKILSTIIICSIIVLAVLNLSKLAIAVGIPLQISPIHESAPSPCGAFYNPPTYTFTYNGGTVWLSGLSDGNGNIYTDDKLDILITHPDGTTASYSKNYGNGQAIIPTVPQNLTTLFKTGDNQVKVNMTDLLGPVCNSSAYWLVETSTGGGDSGAPKPVIKPRTTWHGDDNGIIKQQTVNHIVIHHTRTSNDPGSVGTYGRELWYSYLLDPITFVSDTVISPIAILSRYGDGQYYSIRGTWPGEVWLVWLEHKFITKYDDIGYQYLIDPLGNIYEGRYKGALAENAENKGQNVENGNQGAVGIALLGRYGTDGSTADSLISIFDGVREPTNASLNSAQRLIDWLSSKYVINKTGTYQIPQTVDGIISCKLSPDQCYINNISGHKDFSGKTMSGTACPGDNLYKYLAKFRGANMDSPGTVAPHKSPKGILIGGFSPVDLGVVDPNGNRLGIDPATGQHLANIPEGVYGKLSMVDNESYDPSHDPYWLHIPTTTSGVYKIDVVGTGTGDFALAVEDLETINARAMKGSTTNGQKDNYQIIYSTANSGQLELFHDTVPPVTTGTMTCSRDMNGTCRSAATFKLNATDTGTNGDPASGVLKIECSYDNKVTWQQCGDVNGAQIVIGKNGKTSFYYRGTDRVLNVEAPKYSGVVDVEQFVSIAGTTLKSDRATGLEMTGIAHSNGSMSFTNNTTVKLDILTYIGSFTQSGNVTFNYNQKTQATQTVPLPSYPLSFYKSKCTNYTGSVTLWDTDTAYNKCIYAVGNVTLNTTSTTGKLTIVSEGYIYDNSTGANLQAWDTSNGILFYSAKGYTAKANGATYTGVIYAPTTLINGGLSNSTLNGALYSKTVNFNSGTSLKAYQAAGFPPTTYNLSL